MGLMPSLLQARTNWNAAIMLPWSVTANAGMSMSFAAATNSPTELTA